MKKKITKKEKALLDKINNLEAMIQRLNRENQALYSRAVYAEDRAKTAKHVDPDVDLSSYDNVVLFRRSA